MTTVRSMRREDGFTLVEMLIATVVIAVGIVGVAALISYAVRLQSHSREGRIATALARSQVEQLRLLQRDAPQRLLGGSLDSDEPDHFDDTHDGFICRWEIVAGPAGTQDVTVQVAPAGAVQFRRVRLRTLLR
jgi:prepilin-type N-terminal cleavage/methylation domain-containing protein